MLTVFQCCKEYKNVNKTLMVVYYADTERESIEWLKNNGGGVYRNSLHNFKVPIKGKESTCQQRIL